MRSSTDSSKRKTVTAQRSNLALEWTAGMRRHEQHGSPRLPRGRSTPGRWAAKAERRTVALYRHLTVLSSSPLVAMEDHHEPTARCVRR
jgi:hypothetical protein